MWLVLCEEWDSSAQWAFEGLSSRGLQPIEIVSAPVLSCSLRWEHRLSDAGTTIDITLAGGRRINGAKIRGVLNRLVAVSPLHLGRAAPGDRDYATQEMTAFFMSWIHGLSCPVLNRATTHGLAGRWRHPSEWALLAMQAGLEIAPYRQDSEVSPESAAFAPTDPSAAHVFVVDGQAVSPAPLPQSVVDGCRRLAEIDGSRLIGLDLVTDGNGGWRFTGASVMPELTSGGDSLLDALAVALC